MAKQRELVSDFSQLGQLPDEGRLDAPAFHRNHVAVWSAIAPHLDGRRGEVLEVGSGTGQHVAFFARQSPLVTWLPTDHLDAHLQSIAAWTRKSGLSNIAPPQRVDLLDPGWGADLGSDRFVAIVCINVLHISPWTTSENLLARSARLLRADGKLFVYGAFTRDGRHTTASNDEFDQSLRARDAAWGVRDTAELASLAARTGMVLDEIKEMPANNLTLVFART
jgi:SAM-dependent methyltransferase